MSINNKFFQMTVDETAATMSIIRSWRGTRLFTARVHVEAWHKMRLRLDANWMSYLLLRRDHSATHWLLASLPDALPLPDEMRWFPYTKSLTIACAVALEILFSCYGAGVRPAFVNASPDIPMIKGDFATEWSLEPDKDIDSWCVANGLPTPHDFVSAIK